MSITNSELKQGLQYIIPKLEEPKPQSFENYKTITQKMESDSIQLCKYFLFCLNILRSRSNKIDKITIKLFYQTNQLQEHYYQYNHSKSPYHRQEIIKIITPLHHEICLLIKKMEKAFGAEKDSGLGFLEE